MIHILVIRVSPGLKDFKKNIGQKRLSKELGKDIAEQWGISDS